MIQEPVLFSGSVGENIAYGLPDDHVSKDDVIKAAKAANAHEFIISLPQVGVFQIYCVYCACSWVFFLRNAYFDFEGL